MKIEIVAMIFLIATQVVAATNVDVKMYVSNTVHEDISFHFDTPTSGTFYYTLPVECKNIEIFPGKFSVNESNIIISIQNANDLKISFDTNGIIFKNSDVYQLFTTFNFGNSTTTVSAFIPSGYEILSTFPEAAYSSNGKDIIAKWKINKPSDISIKYRNVSEKNNYAILAVIVLIVIAAVFTSYTTSNSKKRLFEALDEDERKVAELISSKRIIYQNKIEKRLELSRSKMTRIVKRLEKKGLVEKEKRGRTNKLIWKK